LAYQATEPWQAAGGDTANYVIDFTEGQEEEAEKKVKERRKEP